MIVSTSKEEVKMWTIDMDGSEFSTKSWKTKVVVNKTFVDNVHIIACQADGLIHVFSMETTATSELNLSGNLKMKFR